MRLCNRSVFFVQPDICECRNFIVIFYWKMATDDRWLCVFCSLYFYCCLSLRLMITNDDPTLHWIKVANRLREFLNAILWLEFKSRIETNWDSGLSHIILYWILREHSLMTMLISGQGLKKLFIIQISNLGMFFGSQLWPMEDGNKGVYHVKHWWNI